MTRGRRILASAGAAITAVLSLVPGAPDAAHADDAALRARVLAALRGSTAAQTAAGVDVDGLGRAVDVNALTMLPPASTQKLYTGATALLVLGTDFRFRTEVRATGPVLADGTVNGDLVLVGGGDPTLVGDDLQRLAFEVANAGIRRIGGWLYVDDTRWDRARSAPGWKPGWLGDEVAPLSSLLVDGNRWRRDAAYLQNPAVPNLDRFRVALDRAGVTIAGPNALGPAPASPGDLVVSHDSAPLAALVGRMLKDSNNTYAEVLLKELGRTAGDASTNGGIAVVWRTAASFGMGPGQTADGSGLSLHDRAAPWHEVDWLINVSRTPVADYIRFSLPLACGDGTLQQRFCATPAAGKVFAKTGSLDGVSTLAGYTTTASGRRVAFSFELAGCRSTASCRDAIDRAVISIVTYTG
ncbi:MAG TPA: D-alanyl-D-alanine carboxypeptidase/D-alanyl-D-alanine-endopeptidase [Acidimicrobiales bacterium]|nr:D-alanyl-D-alanine carboxypeptidase/D-alanyl-D-alanine-endopeptidase [Acidimicrobiales bacterium]